ncbi:DUF2771 family protein [Amycolatopsis palatopharyngis]|uniref:DUF2771 family protein n=1 Tax=Amycolatopsis palatopharyngis TaxID=187982 RepID=UPI000E24ED9D|nr:DUF2771 family protein [Amycolatopsis palatopharyngis]
MRLRLAALLPCAALVLAGCSASGSEPQVTFYTDGEAAETEPFKYCNVQVSECEEIGAVAELASRPGRPVQISVPSEVSETPWVARIEYLTGDGELREKAEFFSSGTQHAYTATGEGPGYQILVVEVQQPGAAYVVDEAGNPELLMRAVWSLHVTA